MGEFILGCSLAVVYAALFVIYLRWFIAHTQGIRGAIAWSCLLRTLILILFLCWARPAYQEQIGISDADGYYDSALEYHNGLVNGQWQEISPEPGSDAMAFIGALLYSPTHASFEVMSAISVLFSLIGATLFWAAVVLWCGPVAARFFLVGMMFWPSLLYWTGAFGKDNIAFLAMALVAHGYSRLCHSSQFWRPLPELLAGLLLLASIRIHYALVVVVSLGAAELYKTLVEQRSMRRTAVTLAAIVVLSPLCWQAVRSVIAANTEKSVVEGFRDLSEVTAIGGSAVDSLETNSVSDMALNYPSGFVRVLFRPWIWEAHNSFAFLASLESTLLLLLALWRWRPVLRNIQNAARSAFGVYCLAMLLLLILWNSTISNLGTISRYKTLLFPYLLAVVAVPVTKRLAEKADKRLPQGTVREDFSTMASPPQF